MKVFYRMAVVTAAVVGLANPVFAQNPTGAARPSSAAIAKALENAMTPGEGQKKLVPMIGTFDVKISVWVDPAKPPVESTGSAVNTWVLGDRYIQSMLSGYVLDAPYNGIGYVAYDNVGKTYQMAWMDSDSTAMTWYRGAFNSATRSAVLKATVPNAVTAKPTPLELRMTIADNGDHMSELWGQGLGSRMFKMMELRYTRSKK